MPRLRMQKVQRPVSQSSQLPHAWLLLPVAALLATLPLFLHGCSCGHDFSFHLESWLDAARQIRSHTFYPQWIDSAAWNAGEPRFVFYPPLSWLLGAALTLIFPIASVPAIFTWIALTAAALSMYRLAREYAPPNIAVLVATLYLANPYTLFTAFERTAYAELLAAAWLPLLVLAAIERYPRVRSIALVLALLWLTNAPAAVIGSYAFAIIMLIRFVASFFPHPADADPSPWYLAYTSIFGAILGLALPAFYLVPAAYERRYVQIAMAVIPNMRPQDNFLFVHTPDDAHNKVLITVSLIALYLLAIAAILIAALFFRRTPQRQAINLALANFPIEAHILATILVSLTLLIAFLLTRFSLPLWNNAPELAFLQFPWRFLSLLAVLLALTLTLLFRRARLRNYIAVPLTLLVAVSLSATAIHHFRQPCDDTDLPTTQAQLFSTHHGVQPTDEYTPVTADNDVLRFTNPGYWLSRDPQAFAPHTTPNPASSNPNFDPNDLTPSQTTSANAPTHLDLHLTAPQALILNLRDYPSWLVTVHHPGKDDPVYPRHLQRDDGLLAVPLPAGDSTIDITWQHPVDHTLGLLTSLAAALVLGITLLARRSRKIEP